MGSGFATRDHSSCLFHSLTSLSFFFSGVYFTSIDPNNDPKKILLNNYDDRGNVVNSKRLWDKIDWVIEVNMDENKVTKVVFDDPKNQSQNNRDVYLYEGDVDLKNYQCKIYKNPHT